MHAKNSNSYLKIKTYQRFLIPYWKYWNYRVSLRMFKIIIVFFLRKTFNAVSIRTWENCSQAKLKNIFKF